ncbi:MAG: hypothetical protein CMJ28_04055 [Phycisphaerae bacterium]|nr:hypothetical protein [Phycisphaerae bacterium]
MLPLLLCVFFGSDAPPNVLLIFADDLGLHDLGCTGSHRIETPHLDALAEDGMQFTRAYSSACVCAPSRACLLTGKSLATSPIRDNGELPKMEGRFAGQRAMPEGTPTLATRLQHAGYATGAFGKWGLGGVGQPQGHPKHFGFDRFYGYLCQFHAHNLFPRYLDAHEEMVQLPGNDRSLLGETWGPDAICEDALGWLDAVPEDQPWFMYVPTIVPHLALQAPPDLISYYNNKGWEDPAYEGGRGYLPHPTPRAAYAAMITGMDRNIGRLFAAVKARGEWDNTVVIFTSDNGATFELGGFDPDFFGSNRGLRGHKVQLYEGGLRVPMIVRAPGSTVPGSSDDTVVVGYDLHDTILELVEVPGLGEGDGVSLKPLLAGDALPKRPDLYWEHHAGGGWEAGLLDQRWKGVRRRTHRAIPDSMEIFDVVKDPGETNDLAPQRPDLVERLEALFAQRTVSSLPSWNPFRDREAAIASQRTIPAGEVVKVGMLQLAPDERIDVQGTLDGLKEGLAGGQVSVSGTLRRRFLSQGAVCTVKAGGRLELLGGNVPLNNAVVHLEPGGKVIFMGFGLSDLPRHQLAALRVDGTPYTDQEDVQVNALRRGVVVTRSLAD